MLINIVPSQPYLFHPEMHPIPIPVEIHRFFLGRHLDPRQKTALPTSQEFLPVSNMHHRGQGTSDRKSTRLNSSHGYISYAVFCLKKKKKTQNTKHHDIYSQNYDNNSQISH